jgi:hypothetical protein
MSIRQRVKHLERQTMLHAPDRDPYADWLSEWDWLDRFEQWGRQGTFAHEPDFPVALATYRQALVLAAAQTNPPFDPPADFMPNQANPLRQSNWRNSFRFPDVNKAWHWLGEMLERVVKGRPPVTEQEYRELEEWFQKNGDGLHRLESHGLLDLGNGRKTTTANLRHGLWQGPRALGATEVVEDLRQLRKLHGDGNGLKALVLAEAQTNQSTPQTR